MGFAENLNHLMASNDISNYKIAKRLGCAQTSVANWREGRNIPHPKTQEAIARCFGLSIEGLCGDELPDAKWSEQQKKPAPTDGDGLDEDMIEIVEMLKGMSPAEKALVKERVRKIKESRE